MNDTYSTTLYNNLFIRKFNNKNKDTVLSKSPQSRVFPTLRLFYTGLCEGLLHRVYEFVVSNCYMPCVIPLNRPLCLLKEKEIKIGDMVSIGDICIGDKNV